MGELVCSSCKKTYSLNDLRWKCDCGSVLDISFSPVFELAKIRLRKPTMWRYREAIPIHNDRDIVTFDEGFTPLTRVRFKDYPVLVKQDHLFPSASYKDRGASVLISKAKELGVRSVVEDSSGNAGCAIAAYCARARISCEIFVPQSTSAAKLAQIESYGAHLNKVPGSREDTAKAVLQAAEKHYYASHSWNPFFFQGTKTFAYEVCEQLGWKSPDTIIAPAGNGTLVLGCFIGFDDLRSAGIIDTIPKIIAVQSAGCAPLYNAFKEGSREIPVIDKVETIAEGIAIADPIRGVQIIEAVRKSGGDFMIVDDTEVMDSLKAMGLQGFFIEPTSAATTAAVGNYVNTLKKDEVIVSVLTGHGLKSTEKIMKMVKQC